MPSSNMPDPNKIPDMSLDGPADRSPRAQADPASSIQPELSAPAPKATETTPATPDWHEGDRVLAPWEPFFLYPGMIRHIEVDDARGDSAVIAYDDGGEGRVFVYSLCPLEFKKGQEVQMRRHAGNEYALGEVLEVDGDELHIRFDDGPAEWHPITSVRVPCIENGPGAEQLSLADFQLAAQPSSAGLPRWVIWIGIVILIAVLRIGCREMMRN